MTLHFQNQINLLNQKLLRLGSFVEESLDRAIRALLNRDIELASQVMKEDKKIDDLEIEIEEECLKILALYQPVANDLRFLVAMLKINNDLERMGDHAANIAKRARFLSKRDPLDWPPGLEEQTVLVRSMVNNSLDALLRSDEQLARQVCKDDDRVDAAKRAIISSLRELIRQQPEHTDIWLKMMDVPRHLERVADLATNMAEDIIYYCQGVIVRHGKIDDDQS